MVITDQAIFLGSRSLKVVVLNKKEFGKGYSRIVFASGYAGVF